MMMNHQLVKLQLEAQPSNYRTNRGRHGEIIRKGACSDEFMFRPLEGEGLRPKMTLLSKTEGLQFLFVLPEGETIDIEYEIPGVFPLLPFFVTSVPFYQ